MNQVRRIHILILSLVLAVAAAAGLSAAVRTARLGAAARSSQVSSAQLAQRNRQLSRIEAALRSQARALAMPHAQASQQQPVIYVRPKPIIHVVHRPHGGDDEGGGLDD